MSSQWTHSTVEADCTILRKKKVGQRQWTAVSLKTEKNLKRKRIDPFTYILRLTH